MYQVFIFFYVVDEIIKFLFAFLGKTSTILGLVGIALHQTSRVLICSPSNAAVDELVIRIRQRGKIQHSFNRGYSSFSSF